MQDLAPTARPPARILDLTDEADELVVTAGPGAGRSVLIAHPSPDLYGSDRSLLTTVTGLVEAGWRVWVHLPTDGPLVALLRAEGARVQLLPFPVLRKATMAPLSLLGLVAGSPRVIARLAAVIRAARPDVVYVNTVTIPCWLAAARLAGTPAVCHVREAEEGASRLPRWGLAGPLLLATTVLTNSEASRRALLAVVPRLATRTRVVYNGMTGPTRPPAAEPRRGIRRLALVARLSPRKGVDVALEALALLLADGHEVDLEICGTAYPGYEWFEELLRLRAARPDIGGRVIFSGYVNPTYPVLARAAAVLVPSRSEPFGNTAVEGQLARRPVVASGVQGLPEIVEDGRTGLLVAPDDPRALADAVARVLTDEGLARELADAGHTAATRRFGQERYCAQVIAALADTGVAAGRARPQRRATRRYSTRA